VRSTCTRYFLRSLRRYLWWIITTYTQMLINKKSGLLLFSEAL
jgi:hypothetical protein